MDRRFQCQQCHVKWFVPEDATSDLTECLACGGPLAGLDGVSGSEGYGSRPGERADDPGED